MRFLVPLLTAAFASACGQTPGVTDGGSYASNSDHSKNGATDGAAGNAPDGGTLDASNNLPNPAGDCVRSPADDKSCPTSTPVAYECSTTGWPKSNSPFPGCSGQRCEESTCSLWCCN